MTEDQLRDATTFANQPFNVGNGVGVTILNLLAHIRKLQADNAELAKRLEPAELRKEPIVEVKAMLDILYKIRRDRGVGCRMVEIPSGRLHT